MERKIGDTFEYKGRKLKAIETEDIDDCAGCVFFKEDCKQIHSIVGECEGKKRNDDKGVVFVNADEFDECPLIEEPQEETEEPKERKVGEVFEYEGRKLKVTEEIDGCTSCYFRKYNCHNRKIIGECLYNKRSDNKGVIFIDITDESANKQQPKTEPQQKLNLCEVLKHCPKGEPFYSPMFGDVTLYGTDQETKKVLVTAENDVNCVINADGTVTFYGVTSPEVMLYPSRDQRDWSKVKYEKKKLPRSWEEFCKNNPCKKDEWFMSTDCEFYDIKEGIERHINHDRNLLPNKQAAEAHLAFMQLHQLRDAWREGWLPNWTDNTQAKFAIVYNKDEHIVFDSRFISHFLAFQDESRAKEFLKCFKDLIEKAGDLI